MDALLQGCIPIVFLTPTEYRRLWPYHLFGWRDNAMVNIPPSEMLAPRFNLVDHLRTISAARIARMQHAIAMHGQRLAYLADKEYTGEDAADILLKGIAFGLPGR